MGKSQLDILRKEDIQKIKEIVSIYNFNDYRKYRMLDRDKLKEFLFDEISDVLKSENNRIIIASDRDKIIGLLSLVFLPWDTKHFGFNMAKIDYLMVTGDAAQASSVEDKLFSCLLQACKDANIAHLSCRIDIDNISSIHVLETKGFRIMDTLVTYRFNRHKHNIIYIKELYKVRRFKKEDLPVLINIAQEAFAIDRFHLDHHFPHIKANSLFGDWIKNCALERGAHRIFIAEKYKKPVGFLTFKLNKKLEKFTGYKIAGHGLSAVCPKIKGVYPGLVKTAVQDVILHYDCLEFDTQLNNYEVIKVWQKFGFDFIRAKYTFHKWLR